LTMGRGLEVQLNGYAFIFEKLKIGKVDNLFLIYYELSDGISQIDEIMKEDGFYMSFKAHIKRVKLDY